MPRRREIPKREIPADPIYNSPLVTKFISTIMRGGKRSTAERIMYKALDIVKDKSADDPLKVFKKAIDNVKPSLEVKSRRVGGSNYQVPVEVNPNRRLSLSIRWLVGFVGVWVKTRPQTPRFCGLLCRAGLFVLVSTFSRPYRTN
jgi:small subunit ribosomal protein S7